MFSGKTEELIRRLRRAKIARQQVVVFKPRIDNRYNEVQIVSHSAQSISSVPVDNAMAMEQHINQLSQPVNVVGIDEAQFFDDELPAVCGALANRGIRIIVAGLDMDYLGNPFGPIPNLMAVAEYVTKVHAICVKCGDLANHSHRFSSSKDLLHLGE